MPSTLASFRAYLSGLDQEPELEPFVIPEPPEFAYSRELQICTPPERARIPRSTLKEVRELIEREMREYLDIPDPDYMLLIRAAPGTGKTTIAVNVAHDAVARGRIMYAAPRHDFYLDIERACEFNDRPSALWYEWMPRQEEGPQTCIHAKAISQWMQKGREAMEFCAGICGWPYVNDKCPYHAQKRRKNPLVMCQHQHVTLGHPLEFAVVFGDESPLGAFENWRTIDAKSIIPQDLDADSPIRALLYYIKAIAADDGITEGHAIFEHLGDPAHVAELCSEFAVPLDALLQADVPRSLEEAEQADEWYIHLLANILGREATIAATGAEYPHRLLIGNSKLYLLMRHTPNTKLPRHVIWMDATGNRHIYEHLFQRPVKVVDAAPRVLGKIHQICDRANGISTLIKHKMTTDADGNVKKEIKLTDKVEQSRRFIDYVVQAQGYERRAVMTFKDAESLFEPDAGHFYGARGTNRFADCDANFILGAPLPPIDRLKRTAAMIFYERDLPFNTAWHDAYRKYDYVDDDGKGRRYPVGGYWGDADLEAIMQVYRKDEILQVAHRVRPILDAKDIWLITNIPIPELPPTELVTMRDVIGAPPDVNIWKWMDLMEAIEGLDVLTVTVLAERANIHTDTARKYMKKLITSGRWREVTEDDEKVFFRNKGRGGHNKRALIRLCL